MKKRNTAIQLIMVILAGTSLTACNTVDRLEHIGTVPTQSNISDTLIKTSRTPCYHANA